MELNLYNDAEVSIWSNGVFGLNQGNLESLVLALKQFDFAILVLTPDDLLTSRDLSSLAPRDNVMFELGLFMGHLGRDRTFALCSDSHNMRLPSDLSGVTQAKFYSNRKDNNLQAATSPACTLIRKKIIELGNFKLNTNKVQDFKSHETKSSLLYFWDNIKTRHKMQCDARSLIESSKHRVFLSGITLNYIIQHCSDEINSAIERHMPIEIVIAANSRESFLYYSRYSSQVENNLNIARNGSKFISEF